VELILSTFAFSFASALIPVLNIEVYLGAVGTRTSIAEALGLSLVAAAGATLGKIVWYVVARRSVDSAWVQRRLDRPKVRETYDRWEERVRGRPWYAAGVLFAAASIGIPPLLVMAVLAGSLHMRFWVFVLSCFVGRALRFYFILAGVALVT
jgi:membrane protein YqaA with SNARE-associated domain